MMFALLIDFESMSLVFGNQLSLCDCVTLCQSGLASAVGSTSDCRSTGVASLSHLPIHIALVEIDHEIMAPFTKPIWSGPNPCRTTVRSKFGYVNGTLSVPKIWSGPKPGPKRDLLMCKDHGPIEFCPVPNLDM